MTIILFFLVILLIPAIPFFGLAKAYNKSKFGFSAIGIGVFLFSMFISQAILHLAFLIFFGTDNVPFSGSGLNGVINLFAGTIGCVLTYRHLKKKWEKEGRQINADKHSICTYNYLTVVSSCNSILQTRKGLRKI